MCKYVLLHNAVKSLGQHAAGKRYAAAVKGDSVRGAAARRRPRPTAVSVAGKASKVRFNAVQRRQGKTAVSVV